MKRKLLSKVGKSCKTALLTTLGLFALNASAQMSGTVTIDASAAASSTNFKDWYSFWRSLQGLSRSDGGSTLTAGVSGPVTVNVNSDLSESNAIQFPQITGMSSTNTITINGGGKKFSYSGSYEAVSFSGGDYFRIKNLIISHTNSSTTSAGIRFYGGSDYNLVEKCTIEFTAMVSASTSSSAYVYWGYSQGALTSATSTATGSYDTIRGCVMQTTGVNPAGPAIAIAINGNTGNYSSTPQNNTITGNTIKNFYYMGFFNYYTNGNQFLNNDISRSNATSSSSTYSAPYFSYSYQTYSTNRSTKIDGNSFHDLPYIGASASSSPYSYFYNYIYYNYGSSSNYFSFSSNTFKNIMCYYYCYGVYGYYNYQCNFNTNTWDNIQTYASGYSSYIYQMYYGNDHNYIGNKVQNCSFGYYGYPFYLYNITNSVQSYMSFEDNVIQNNYAGYYFYSCFIYYYGAWKVNRNRLIKNSTPTNQGYFYGLYMYYLYNLQANSNVIADNYGYYGNYNWYTYSANSNAIYEARQNTIRSVSSGYSGHFVYGMINQQYATADNRIAGNIINCEGSNYVYVNWIYTSSTTQIKECDNNSYWCPNVGTQAWEFSTTQNSSFSGWITSGPGPGESWHYPEYMNLSTQDYRAKEYSTQNSTITSSTNTLDAAGNQRNPGFSDRGGLELAMDIKAEGTNFSVPSSVCQGYTTSGGTKIYVRSNYTWDTAYNIKVAYSVNNGTKVSAVTKKKILYNQLDTATFTIPLTLSTVGLNTIRIFVDNGDDVRSNDTLKFTTTVKPAPGGEKLTYGTKATKALYQNGKINDVTIVNQPVYYTFNSPKTAFVNYSNADYGTKWTATAWATSLAGRALTSSEATVTHTPPSGSVDQEVMFKAIDANLEDTMCYVYLKVSDLTNGCDTVLRRRVLVYPSIKVKFSYPSKICAGDAVDFTQQCSVKSGAIEFHWDFGTGKATDKTDAPDPVFQFPGTGTYKVKLTCNTLPYGFEFSDSVNVTVNAIPTVKFTKLNACEGNAVKFTNQSSPANATLDWDFGDNTSHSSLANPSHLYANTGSYNATLTASLNGCIASQTQRVYQFDKPKAGFSLVAGNCDNESFDFQSQNTIKNGLVGNFWNFNDGNVSTEDDPSHMFASPGSKAVKLVATSEFGCKDSITKTIVVKESPKVAYTNTPACSITPTTFTNLTPPVSGTVANYKWDFGDGSAIATSKDVTHSWTTLGPKTVMLTINLDNGCKAEVSKDLVVGVQPTAQFSATNVCSGQPVVFENNTTWAQGDISYLWDFGNTGTSTSSDPTYNYGAVTKTTTYFVTLKASIAGGCSDSIRKAVTINEGPKTCDFKGDPDYAFGFRGMKFNPLDAAGAQLSQSGVTYTWVVKGGGTLNGATPSYDFQQDGEYEVTMRAKVDATGCECTVTKKVVMNRTAAEDLVKFGMGLYPNPSTGNFNIALTESFGKDVTVQLISATGAVVKTMRSANNGLVVVDAADLANGVYSVRVSSLSKVVVRSIQIQK